MTGGVDQSNLHDFQVLRIGAPWAFLQYCTLRDLTLSGTTRPCEQTHNRRPTAVHAIIDNRP